MQDVGCPEPAAVVDIIERMLNRFAFCWMASIIAADGAVAVVISLSLRFRLLILRSVWLAAGRSIFLEKAGGCVISSAQSTHLP
jgi:hypothetical protein